MPEPRVAQRPSRSAPDDRDRPSNPEERAAPVLWAASLLAVWVIGAFVLGAPLWDEVHDPQALLRLIHRLTVTVPVAVCLAIFAVRAFDRFTPNDWMNRVSDNETACSVVLASLILGVFWLCVQG